MHSTSRLYFLDALRAFAILMMLQGHFVSGLLDPAWKNPENNFYAFWLYCRGFTAPVFFTLTGWVFAFLLLRNPLQGWHNPRVKKGFKRMGELILWGYLLRLNFLSFLSGTPNRSFFYPDVLQIIGLGIGFLLCIYLLCHPLKKGITAFVFLTIGLVIFMAQPLYVDHSFPWLPKAIAAYLTKANGGVFYLFPWLGYVSIGAFIAYVFPANTQQLWAWASGFFGLGYWLIVHSSSFFISLEQSGAGSLFRQVAYNNFLFIRLGDVFLLVGLFMAINRLLKGSLWAKIGRETLRIYIIHYFILYGSLTGFGLYKIFFQKLSLLATCSGLVGFVFCCTSLALYLPHIKTRMKQKIYIP